MANITRNDISVLKIRNFLGLNENPDGDTAIRTGEMAQMRNFRITRDGHLQLRPGQKTLLKLYEAWLAWAEICLPDIDEPRFCGAWEGQVGEKRWILAAFGGAIFKLDLQVKSAVPIGSCTQDDTTFFGFGGKVYLLNGHEYMRWDGGDDTEFTPVEGYIPTVLTAAAPDGNGTLLENVNRLTPLRRVKYSPDGESSVFSVPQQTINIESVDGPDGWEADFTFDLDALTVTFTEAPPAGVNTLSIICRAQDDDRAAVTKMRFAELFNGTTDTRVFLYGDGSNRCIYSGMDLETGLPSAEYFPDLYEAAVGDENTPITAMVRHYARLLAFKPASAWSVDYGVTTSALDAVTPLFYVTAVNRQFGNEPMGQVRLLENNPLTVDAGSVYQWKASSGGYFTSDNRNAGRISDRVRESFADFEDAKVKTFNRRREQEYWFLCGGRACILNYANDTWYLYTNMDFAQLLETEEALYGFRPDGSVAELSRAYRSDDGDAIDAYAETGSMSFDRTWMRKCVPELFVTLQPENGACISVTVETDRRSDYPEKSVAAGIAGFTHVNFAHWSFGVSRKPQVQRLKMKVKKAAFCKLVFRSLSASATATVLETDLHLRYTGNVK